MTYLRAALDITAMVVVGAVLAVVFVTLSPLLFVYIVLDNMGDRH